MEYDPTAFLGSAPHYLRGRPPYSPELLAVLTRELGLDGTGRLLDVGCGPGVLAVQLAAGFTDVIGLDPDPAMLAEARRHAAASSVRNVRWILGRAEHVTELLTEHGLGSLRMVTFGQSFHWTDREAVAEQIYDLLQPGCSAAMVTHDIDARQHPQGPGDPLIPHQAIREIVDSYLGPWPRRPLPPDRYEHALARTRFRESYAIHAPGREDITQDIDGVISNYLSMSYAAPHLFGARLDDFVADVRALLEPLTPTGRFWDWPGDTWILIATKPSS